MFKSSPFRLLAVSAALLVCTLAGIVRADPIEVKPFGTDPDGNAVSQIILTNKKGSSVRLINYGAIVTNIFVPDKNGKMGDVVLGFDSAKDYAQAGPFMGCIPGRYANRIAKGMFTIDSINYAVPINNGPNSLHGGFKGYAKRMWNFDTGVTPDGPTVRFTLLDPDGTEGYPGNVNVTVLFTLTQADALKIQYYARTDKATPINLTHHSYFNLSGDGTTDVLGYVAKLYADQYLPVDETLIPIGQVSPVSGTPMDFTKAKLIGQDIKSMPGAIPGYDCPMVLDSQTGELAEAADVYDPGSGRLLQCWTTEPCVQFFTAQNLTGIVGKGGTAYAPYHAFCLETQHFPDSPNHPDFPNTILHPGQVYRQITEFRFSVPSTPLTPGQ